MSGTVDFNRHLNVISGPKNMFIRDNNKQISSPGQLYPQVLKSFPLDRITLRDTVPRNSLFFFFSFFINICRLSIFSVLKPF